MAISRYNRPAELNLIDTYVPLPFKEIKATIDQKQNAYDITEETFEKTPSILDSIKVHETWEDSYGNTVGKNIAFDLVEAKKAQVAKTQQALFDKHKGDWSTPEAQKDIRAFANSVAGWVENTGKPLQNKSNQYLKERDEAAKKKHDLGYQDIYNNFNSKIYQEVEKGNKGKIDADWQSPTYNEYLDKSEAVNKATTNLGSIVKEWSGGRKTNLNDLTAEEYKTFRKSNASQIDSAKQGLLSQLNQKHQQESLELARQLAPSQGMSPEELYNKEIRYKDSQGREVKTTWGQAQKQKLDQEVSSLFDAKLNVERKDLTDYSNLNKAQLGLFGIGEDGKKIQANQYYESSAIPLQNEINTEALSNPIMYVHNKLGVEEVNPTGLLGIKTSDGKEITNKIAGTKIQEFEKEYQAKTGKQAYGILNYEDGFISWLEKTKDIKWANEVGHKNKQRNAISPAIFSYSDSRYKEELKKADDLKKVLENPSNPKFKEEIFKSNPAFKGVYEFLKVQGINNPNKQQLLDTYNRIAPAFSSGEEVVIDDDTQKNTLKQLIMNQRTLSVNNKLDLKGDSKIPINSIPVYYKGETKTVGELLAEGVKFNELYDSGAISLGKEAINPSSTGGSTIKVKDEDGNLLEYQTGGDNNIERKYFNDNKNYFPEVNKSNDFYSNAGDEILGESPKDSYVHNDPLIQSYLNKINPNLLKDNRPYYSVVKTKVYEDENGVYSPQVFIDVIDGYSGKPIAENIPRDQFMNFRKNSWDKGVLVTGTRKKETDYKEEE
jgi:hypothetical protein